MKKQVMKRLTFVCLGLFLITAVAPDAFAWRGGAGAVRGPNGGTAYRGGYYGGAVVRPGVAAGVAVGAAAGAASATYPYYYYPPHY
jgi:hypothetical protein